MKSLFINLLPDFRTEGFTTPFSLPENKAKREFAISSIIAAIAFVAVGTLAYLGLKQITGTDSSRHLYSSAPPSGTAAMLMRAIQNPHEREQDAARLALLNLPSGAMEIQPLERVEQLVQPDAVVPATAQVTSVEPRVISQTPEQIATTAALKASATVEEAPQAPVAVSAASCFDTVSAKALESSVYFRSGSAIVEESALDVVRAFGEATVECPEVIIHVTGHSDTTGDDSINMTLSWQRADNVVAALTGLGIDTKQFEPVGFGARSPLSQGAASDDDLNRRVEFMVLQAHH